MLFSVSKRCLDKGYFRDLYKTGSQPFCFLLQLFHFVVDGGVQSEHFVVFLKTSYKAASYQSSLNFAWQFQRSVNSKLTSQPFWCCCLVNCDAFCGIFVKGDEMKIPVKFIFSPASEKKGHKGPLLTKDGQDSGQLVDYTI